MIFQRYDAIPQRIKGWTICSQTTFKISILTFYNVASFFKQFSIQIFGIIFILKTQTHVRLMWLFHHQEYMRLGSAFDKEAMVPTPKVLHRCATYLKALVFFL
ncbi:hypothetical protein Hdeb2414_s0003g00103861 [Helianthus debilis subsp. tardiflorus]